MLRQVWTNPANKGERVRRLGEALAFPAWTRLTDRCWTTRYAGGQLVLPRGQGASVAVYARLPDYREMTFWLRHLRPGDLFIDVGANIGIHTLLMVNHGCEVIAVEPDPDARRLLAANLDLNGAHATIVPAALGRAEGEVVITAGLGSMNYVVEHPGGPQTDVQQTTTVPLTTFDAVLNGRRATGAKIDVEGFEEDVLLGASRSLAEQRVGVIQLEWNRMAREHFGRSRADVSSLLQDHCYALARPDGHGDLRPIDSADDGPDVFAVSRRLVGDLVRPDE